MPCQRALLVVVRSRILSFTGALLVASTAGIARVPSTTAAWPGGNRSFTLGAQLRQDQSVSIALHPSSQRVQVSIRPARVAILCPSTLDGETTGRASRWLPACIPAGDGGVMLPPTSGQEHVAFAVKVPVGPARALAIQVTYEPADAFVEVITPTTQPLDVRFTPRTRTVGVQAFTAHGFEAGPAARVTATQPGRPDSRRIGPCDFPSEIECFAGFRPGREVKISLTFTRSTTKRTAVWLSWT